MHPLDGVCAFLGALGFIGVIIAVPVCAAFEWGNNSTEKLCNKQHKSEYPVTLFVALVTIGLLVITLILAFVNMALPVTGK